MMTAIRTVRHYGKVAMPLFVLVELCVFTRFFGTIDLRWTPSSDVVVFPFTY